MSSLHRISHTRRRKPRDAAELPGSYQLHKWTPRRQQKYYFRLVLLKAYACTCLHLFSGTALYCLLWPPYVIWQAIIFLPCGFFFISSIFFLSSPNLSDCRLDVYHTSTHGVALVREFRMQVWNVLHVACWKCRTRKIAKNSPSGHHRTTLSGYIVATKARINNREKNSLNSNISTYSHNMVNLAH